MFASMERALKNALGTAPDPAEQLWPLVNRYNACVVCSVVGLLAYGVHCAVGKIFLGMVILSATISYYHTKESFRYLARELSHELSILYIQLRAAAYRGFVALHPNPSATLHLRTFFYTTQARFTRWFW